MILIFNTDQILIKDSWCICQFSCFCAIISSWELKVSSLPISSKHYIMHLLSFDNNMTGWKEFDSN